MANHRAKNKRKQKEKRQEARPCKRTLKNLREMKLTVVPVEIGALGTIPKRDWKIKLRTIQTIVQSRSASILRRVQES